MIPRFLVKAVFWIALALSAAIGAASFLTGVGMAWWRGFATWMASFTSLIPILGITQAVSKGIEAALPPSDRVLRAVHGFLDQERFKLFGDERGPEYEHRLTLFQYRTWNWRRDSLFPPGEGWRLPWSGWLVPVERSGDPNQKMSFAFWCPRQEKKAQGIAGLAYHCRSAVLRQSLPNLKPNATDAEIATYAKKGYVSKAWVKHRLRRQGLCAQSFCGIVVKVRGKRWGVVVIDSHKEKLREDENDTADFEPIGPVVGYILEGGL